MAFLDLEAVTLTVDKNLAIGRVVVRTDNEEEVFRYDLDTGSLRSPRAIAVPEPSVHMPAANP